MLSTEEKKLRNSVVRNSIYEYLYGTKEHPSAEMIYINLKAENPNLSLGTVYRNLNQLEEMGRVVRVTTVDNHEQYDANCDDHVHLVCSKCGRVIDLMNADINAIIKGCNFNGSTKINHIKIVLEGTCDICSEE